MHVLAFLRLRTGSPSGSGPAGDAHSRTGAALAPTLTKIFRFHVIQLVLRGDAVSVELVGAQ